jgi:hypothetical protein
MTVLYGALEYIFQLPGICCCPSSMSLFARSIPFKYRWGFREKSRVDLQMWGAAMGSYIVNPGALRCGPKVVQGQWSVYTAVEACRWACCYLRIDTGFVAIAVDEVVAGLVQGRLLLNSESEVPRAWPLLKLISFSLTMR